jgi:PGF-pre-PGF domain-containing protein
MVGLKVCKSITSVIYKQFIILKDNIIYMRRELLILFICIVALTSIITYVSGGDPRANLFYDIQLESNSTLHYDVDGYVALNWTFIGSSSEVLAQNFTVWTNSQWWTGDYTTNGTNSSANGFDFHGTDGNWTFIIEPFNNTGSSGQNASYNSSIHWIVIDKTAPTGLNIISNTSAYYDIDGYTTLNWTRATGPAPKNYIIWISSDRGTTYTQNGSNTSATGFDFHGIDGNYTFRIQWSVNDSGIIFNGNNLTWLTLNYDIDGYVTLNWTFVNGSSEVLAQNFTVWTNSQWWTGDYTTNGTNSSAIISGANIKHGFDFHGTDGNWTFIIEPFNNTGSSGQNASYNSSIHWIMIDRTAPTGLNIISNTSNYNSDGHIAINWTQPTGPSDVVNYTIWISTDKGTTYTQNGSNSSATGFDFYGIEANYTFKIGWSGGKDGSVFDGNNLTWANGSYWFQIDKGDPMIDSFSCTDGSQGQTVTCECSASDTLSGMSTTIFTLNPSTTTVGTFSTTCTATDNAGNSVSNTTTYTITAGGGDTSGNGDGATTIAPSVSKTWGTVDSGAAVSMSLQKEGLDFSEITLEVVNDANNVEITVTKLSGQPAGVTQTVSGQSYQYVEMETRNLAEDNVQQATSSFKVEQSWISENNIDKNTVSLHRWADEQWNELTTSLESEDDDYAYYDSELPGFSFFVISADEISVVCDNDGTCEAAQGETTANCPNDCPLGITCTAGAIQCSGDNLQQCNANDSTWVINQTCQYGCNSTTLECNTTSPEVPTGDVIALIIILAVIAVGGIIFYQFFYKKQMKTKTNHKKPEKPTSS